MRQSCEENRAEETGMQTHLNILIPFVDLEEYERSDVTLGFRDRQ